LTSSNFAGYEDAAWIDHFEKGPGAQIGRAAGIVIVLKEFGISN